MTAEHLTEHVPESGKEYILHHITNLTQKGADKQTSLLDFSYINIDTIFWSVLLGSVVVYFLSKAANKATSGVPSRYQMAIEMLVEMVENQSKALISGDRSFIAPLGLTVFLWVAFMNAMDFIPVDLPSAILGWFGIHLPYQRVVPTADINGAMGLAFGVLLLMLFYNVKIKGMKGFAHELFTAPFGPYLLPFNLLLNIVEFCSKALSLGMRLFGNMFAGELLFCLIALLGATATWYGFALHLIAGAAWAIFHILVVLLQAYIFMVLTLVYIGQAHEHH